MSNIELLNQLPPQRREIFHLSRVENLSYTEIAERMGLSVHTVRNQMSSALRHFRKHILENNPNIWLYFVLSFSIA